MGKALVIKSVDFSANKLATVSYGGVPCTGISLDQSTKSIVEFTTGALVATLTPPNTTDEVTWTSSDASVATVNNGTVTAVTEGTATITATCGSHSDSCVVSVTSSKIAGYGKYLVVIGSNGVLNEYLIATVAYQDRGVAIGSSVENGYHAVGVGSDITTNGYKDMYPYPIPEGATKVKVSCADFGIMFEFLNSKAKASGTTTFNPNRDAAKVLDGETAAGGTPWSIASWIYDERTISIPDIEGIDSVIVNLYAKDSTAYSNFDLDDVTIEFLYD